MPTIEPAAGPGSDDRLIVRAYDNFHLSGEAEKYEVGRFATCDEALEACRKLVDEFLDGAFREGMSADELRGEYEAFGPDPYIEPRDSGCVFEARRYAAQRAGAIVGTV